MRDRMFSYNRYPYNFASVQRALLAPEILNESFLKFLDALWPYISGARFTRSPLLASRLRAGRRSAPWDRAMAGLLLCVDSLSSTGDASMDSCHVARMTIN